MSSVLISQGLVLATAMAVSSTLLFLTFSRHKTFSISPTLLSGDNQDQQQHVLRSCLYSGDKKRERRKKKVQFAENVKEPNSNGDEFRKQHKNRIKIETVSCRNETSSGSQVMPANRIALYNGILKDRVHRMACSN
ncbi:hypothetical protein FNV43_RR06969 [Rhamnella rubrinervis]|uniref:Uncharacterized protein n=1 Tax=Rhamnella rubrinervis TaxID=2594499 RepID=A0A8K0HEH6_9ROSA|nr:hypothetical protein FNV43_RR06969 [Rhamnella rubrinervis]